MEKRYIATGSRIRDIIECDNDSRAFDTQLYQGSSMGIKDIIMIGRINKLPDGACESIRWSLNGLLPSNNNGDEIIIFEPLENQINNGKLNNLSESNTNFSSPITLSKKSIVLMPLKKYKELLEDEKSKKMMEQLDVRTYIGEEDLAVKMVLYDKNYIYIDVDENGYILDKEKHPDVIKYAEILKRVQNEYKSIPKEEKIYEKEETKNLPEENEKEIQSPDYKIITGLTQNVEGEIHIDDDLYASTSIGKVRDNQEDAVLLIKDSENPNFKMMVLADGMGGWNHRRSSK